MLTVLPLRGPESSAAYHRAFLVATSVYAVAVSAYVLADGGRSAGERLTILGLVGLVVLRAWWTGNRRPPSVVGDAAELTAMGTLAALLGSLIPILGLLLFAWCTRVAQGRRDMARAAAIYGGAYLIALAGAWDSPSVGFATVAIAAPLVGLHPFAAGWLLQALEAAERATRREEVLAASSTELGTARTLEDLDAAVGAALDRLTQLTDDATAFFARTDETAATVEIAQTRGDGAEGLRGTRIDVGELRTALDHLERRGVRSTLVLGPQSARSLGRQWGVELPQGHLTLGLVVVASQLSGVVAVGTPEVLGSNDRDALAALASEIGLVLDRLHLLEALEGSERRFRALVEHSSDLVLEVDRAGTIHLASAQARSLLGTAPEGLRGTCLFDLVHQDDREHVQHLLTEPGRRATVSAEWRFRHRDGHWIDTETALSDRRDDPDMADYVLTTRDVSERKALQRELSHQAFHDTLTGAANRALFAERLGHALERRAATNATAAVFFIDLDGFKRVNDQYGHSFGDRVLVATTDRVRTTVRTQDTVARLGGDEFAVLLEGLADAADARRIADRVAEVLARPMELDGVSVRCRASVGLAFLRPEDRDVEAMLRRADLAMYQAKAAGPGTVVEHSARLEDATRTRHALENDLHAAIPQGEIAVWYQPLVTVEDGTVVGLEALARWNSSRHGQVPPGVFIPLAEEIGLIDEIDQHVLGVACRDLAGWRVHHPDLTVSVNVSARNLESDGLVTAVEDTLADTGLPGQALVLELTETAIMQYPATAGAVIEELRSRSVRVALDDFGTGYSALGHLARFPLDQLKIDRVFLTGAQGGERGEQMLTAIVELGRRLGIDTVAEGVEESHHRDALVEARCKFAQGYLFGGPAPAETIAGRLQLVGGAGSSSRRPARRVPIEHPGG
ncbi:putative bifunctional diguanylate cyclase/phosphodiesterase [Egibacter rhizosphaerae]|uniref:putative bifunctional diguanylate cyclase/phosphodiesterase n=1 Tax=Egibacter rhizosphaerae TaxID=1670831 RepID=UPI00197AA7D3|nr:bifunctional diguanylate cyclase/phosphodiesterase [Egibacter rhizosphaerae]